MSEVSNRTSYIDVVGIKQELYENPETLAAAADIIRRNPNTIDDKSIDVSKIEQVHGDRSEKVIDLLQTVGNFLKNEGILRLPAIDREVVIRARADESQKQVIYDLVLSNNGNPANYLKQEDLPSDKSSIEEIKKQKASEMAARKASAELAKRYGHAALNAFDPEKRQLDKLVSLSKSANLLRILALDRIEHLKNIKQNKPEAESAAS